MFFCCSALDRQIQSAFYPLNGNVVNGNIGQYAPGFVLGGVSGGFVDYFTGRGLSPKSECLG